MWKILIKYWCEFDNQDMDNLLFKWFGKQIIRVFAKTMKKKTQGSHSVV